MNRLTSARASAAAPDHDAHFQNWIARAEDMLGRDLGAEIETAFACFQQGCSVVEYVLDVQGRGN
jgi:hypothetical protein